jgi:hypothetical protein
LLSQTAQMVAATRRSAAGKLQSNENTTRWG